MRIKVNEQLFSYIEVYKCNYLFEKNNSGPVVCRDCKGGIVKGLGIYRQTYRRAGFLCFACFAKDLGILTNTYAGDAGFFIDTLGRLRACYLNRPTYSTPEVIEAVYKSLLDQSYKSIDVLLGDEAA